MTIVATPGLTGQAVFGEAVLFYLAGYAAVNLGAFGVIAALSRDGREPQTASDLAGLAERRPALAAAFAVFLLSLTGLPPFAGFTDVIVAIARSPSFRRARAEGSVRA